MKKRTLINIFMAFVIALIGVVLYYRQIGFLESFENKTYDLRFKMRGPLPPSEDIALIIIDEKSIKELGRFPWTRKHYADLIDIVTAGGAKALLFDAFFPEKESLKADRAFANSVRRSGLVTLAVVIEFSKDGRAVNLIENLPLLQGFAKNISHINMTPDEDGVVRWSPLLLPYEDKPYSSLSLTAAKEALGADKIDAGDYEIEVGSVSIPVDSSYRMLINYSGHETYKRYSFSDVLKGRISKDELRGKILFVGATAVGIYDLRVTPLSNNTPGVEVNANIADNIIKGSFMRRGGKEALIDLLFIVSLTLITYFVTLKVRASIAFPFAVILMLGYIYFAYRVFLSGQWISMVYPVMSIIFSYSVSASLRFFTVERRAKAMRKMFSSYVSKKIVDELVRHPEKAKVGGDRKIITVLFTDVKGYTAFSEKHTPEVVVRILNEFLSEMTDAIMHYDGTLDKFLGDGIFAFWGAPIEQENQAELAVTCSLEMMKKMKRLQAKWVSEGREPLECGIGINTGDAIVGNIGVEGKKVDYTAIGDSVNLTHRLQNLSREVKKPVITEALYQRVKDIVDAECLREVTVRGREGAISVYAVKGLKGMAES